MLLELNYGFLFLCPLVRYQEILPPDVSSSDDSPLGDFTSRVNEGLAKEELVNLTVDMGREPTPRAKCYPIFHYFTDPPR